MMWDIECASYHEAYEGGFTNDALICIITAQRALLLRKPRAKQVSRKAEGR